VTSSRGCTDSSSTRATAPDDVQVAVVASTWTFSWQDRSDEHFVRAFGVPRRVPPTDFVGCVSWRLNN